MNRIVIEDTVAFRQGVQEYGFTLAATAIGSITVSNEGSLEFPVTINGVRLNAYITCVHPVPRADSYLGAVAMLAVLVPAEHRAAVNAPEHHFMQEPVHCLVQITADHVGGDYRAYDYEVADSTLRLLS